jgi:glyoxylase-like metal-dependent hydrolase (beta-lactamase superfamily II)
MHLPVAQVPGVYHRKIGDIVVTALTDGYADVPLTACLNLPKEDGELLMKQAFRSPVPRVSVNCFAVYSAGRLALIETGSGNTMGPTLGWLPRSLKAAGIKYEDVETVLLTHMHPDHSNGLTDDDGKPLFQNSEIVVSGAEVDHWHDDAAMAKATERQKLRYFRGARIQLAPYRSQLRRITSGEVFPGVTALPIPGHTPGHTAYLIASGSEQLLIWGDTVHMPDIQIPRPDIAMELDSDPAAAAASRLRVFDMAVTDRLLIGGMHMHFPGFSYLTKENGQYRLVADPWDFRI